MDKITSQETWKQGRILIADDDTDIIDFLCDVFMEHGFMPVGCTSGREALNALRQQEFDLLLADLKMPEMGGLELLQLALEIDPNLVGIIITGHCTVRSAIEARMAGAFDYVLKPFEMNKLLIIISRAMQRRHKLRGGGLTRTGFEMKAVINRLQQ